MSGNRILQACVLTILWCAGLGACFAQRTILVPADVPSIQGAIDSASNGDTVLVSAGTYDENIDFKGKSILVTTGANSYADAGKVILHGTKDGPVVSFSNNETAAAVLNGFTIENGHSSLKSGLAGGGVSILSASPTITNNVVANNLGCGIYVYGGHASPLIQGNRITGTRGAMTTGIQGSPCAAAGQAGGGSGTGTSIQLTEAGTVRLVGNLIEDNIGDNTYIGNGCTPTINIFLGIEVLVENNIIRNNKSNCDVALTTGFEPPGKLSLIQNLIYGNVNTATTEQVQVLMSGTSSPPYPTILEVNNTIVGGAQEFVLTYGPSTVANNILWNNSSDPQIESFGGAWCAGPYVPGGPLNMHNNDILNTGYPATPTCPAGEGDLSIDPQFVNAAQEDYHTQANSPVVKAGDVTSPGIPRADLDGKARTVCEMIDMGAYEIRPHPPVSLSTSMNPAPGGSKLTFTARVTSANCNMPTGTVTFFDGSTAIGTATLDGSATAALITDFLVVGNHNITAAYSGDFNFDSSTSAVLTQTITGASTSTTLTVVPNPATTLKPITFASNVTSPDIIPNGTVIFTANGQDIATGALNSAGSTSATIPKLGAGTYSVVANYQATTLFHASSSAPLQLTVHGTTSNTTLAASPNPASLTQTVEVSVKVAASGSATVPTGTVTLLDGGNVLKTTTLDANGSAIVPVSTLSVGTHTITARYGGDANFDSSTATVSEVIVLIGTAVNLTASPNPANGGQTVTMTATVEPSLSGAAPAGTITFYDGSAALGAVPLTSSGTAAFSTSALALGTHPITASLAPTSTFTGGKSGVVNEVVQAYDFALSLSKDSLALPPGGWTVVTVTVSPIGGFSGLVSLGCTGAPAHAQCEFPSGNSVVIGGTARTLQLAVNTSDVYGWGKEISQVKPRRGLPSQSAGLFSLCCALPIFSLAGLRRRPRNVGSTILRLLVPAFFLVALMGIAACSGKNPAVATPGTYTLTVSGASGSSANASSSLQHSMSIRLSVTK